MAHTEGKSVELMLMQMMASQQEQLAKLTVLTEKILAGDALHSPGKPNTHFEVKQPTIVDLSAMLDTFTYDPEHDMTFSAWYGRYEEVFRTEAHHLGEKGKVQLLLMQLEPVANKMYRDSILPSKPDAFKFDETVDTLKTLFDPRQSLFCKRFNTLQIRRAADEDFSAYGARVNRLAEEFQVGSFGADQLKCLLYVLGFDGIKDKEVRTRLMVVMETNPKVTLKEMITESGRVTTAKADAALGVSSSVHEVKDRENGHLHAPCSSSCWKNDKNKSPTRSKTPAAGNNSSAHSKTPAASKRMSPCWGCGKMHLYADCPYKTRTCVDCGKDGHKAGLCLAWGSAKVNVITTIDNIDDSNTVSDVRPRFDISRIDVQNVNTRRFVTIEVNGKPISLQYDCGADISLINEETWHLIGSPPLRSPGCSTVDASENHIAILGEAQVNLELMGKKAAGRLFVRRSGANLFGIEWIVLFQLWDVAPSTFCNTVIDNNQHPKKQVDTDLPVSFKEIVAATQEDQVLPFIMNFVRNGWPTVQENTEIGPVTVFRRAKECLSEERGALMYMNRTIIPPLLQKRVLAQLHKNHPGISRMTTVARANVFWLGMDQDIQILVNKCKQCQLTEEAHSKSLLPQFISEPFTSFRRGEGIEYNKTTNHHIHSNEQVDAAFKRSAIQKHRRRSFSSGDTVIYKPTALQSWTPARVLERVGAVMYTILTEDGQLRRVHVNQLRPSEVSIRDDLFQVPTQKEQAPMAVQPRINPRAVTRSSPPVLRPRPARAKN